MKTNSHEAKKIVERLQEFGYQPEELQLLFLTPFVQVAWAEGFVQPHERRAILKLAARLKITPHHPYYTELIEWLDVKPGDDFFAQSTEILREMLELLPPFQSYSLRQILEAGCFKVAQAAPDVGFFRHRSRITPEERDELYRLGKILSFSLDHRLN